MDFDYGMNNFNSGPNFVAVLKDQKQIIEKIKGQPKAGYPSR